MAKPITSLPILVSLVMTGTGCSYLSDRGRDAADMFTLTGGFGLGATARVGPVRAGLYAGEDLVGLKGGELIWGGDTTTSGTFVIGPIPGLMGIEEFRTRSDEAAVESRSKWYQANPSPNYPFIMTPSGQNSQPYHTTPDYRGKYPYYYWTQMEVAVGLGVSVRAGFNPGELVDFVLGWFGTDIYGDDLSRIKKKLAEEESEPAVSPAI
jgi:hypothetical protein